MRRASGLWPVVALALAGCASIQPARMVLPEGLAAASQEVVLRGLGGRREGEYTLAGNHGRFQRTNDRLDVFDIVSFDSTPRVWLPTANPAQRRGVLLAVMPLALLWDPAALHD